MSWSKQVTIWCDTPDCGEWEQLSGNNVSWVEKDLEPFGWKKIKNKNYCPTCAIKINKDK